MSKSTAIATPNSKEEGRAPLHGGADIDGDASLVLILTYAGKLPNYFDLFLRSAACNPTVQWVLLCDTPTTDRLPANVRWVDFSVEDLARRAQRRLGITPKIEHPYKICDFKPTIGLLYPELVEGFDFWGHCDPDIIWGDIRRFTRLRRHDSPTKVQGSGAYSIYRNDDEGNTLFMRPHPWVSYRDVLSSPKNFCFDEWPGIWKLVERHGVSCSNDIYMAEILVGRADLRLQWGTNHPLQLFYWTDGRLFRQYWDRGGGTDEFAYAHLQKRRFTAPNIDETLRGFGILPGHFEPISNLSNLQSLATRNAGDWKADIRFQLTRPWRYLRAMGRFDRSLLRRQRDPCPP